jgi:hypothetical protein
MNPFEYTPPPADQTFVPMLMEHSAADDLALDGFWESAASAYKEAYTKASTNELKQHLRQKAEWALRAVCAQHDCGWPSPMYVGIDGSTLIRYADMRPIGGSMDLNRAVNLRAAYNADLVEQVQSLSNHHQYKLAKIAVGILPESEIQWQPLGVGIMRAGFANGCSAIITQNYFNEAASLRFEAPELLGPATSAVFFDVETAKKQAIRYFSRWLKYTQRMHTQAARNWSATDVTRN